MMINHMCTSKVLTNLCFPKQKIETRNIFVRVVYSVLVVKMCWQNIKKIVLSINGAQNHKKEQLSLKTFSNKYQPHLKFILILSVIQRVLKFMKTLT